MAEPCRILVVDDYQDQAESLRSLLELWGHAACTAKTPDEAIEKAAEFKPDVVLLDIALPYKNGYELGRELMERHPKCKIAAVTGLGSPEHVELSKNNGFKYHLLKPVTPEYLAKIVEDDLCKDSGGCDK